METVQSHLIRTGRPADAAMLSSFAERCFREAFAADNPAADLELYVRQAYGERQQAAELDDPAVTTLIAESGGHLMAFAQIRPGRAPEWVRESAPVELWRFYVDRPWQGRGLAGSLMRAVVAAALARGADALWLGVWERNPRAQAFYRKCGFVDVGQQQFLLGTDRQTDRVMVLGLQPPGA